MNRRNAILALVALGAPLPLMAQPAGKLRRIGVLAVLSRSTPSHPYYAEFMRGMRELGYVDGQNIIIEWRFADGDFARVPGLTAELVRLNVEVIVTHGTPATLAARRVTSSIPIVTAAAPDPVASGFAASLSRPGGNVTGFSVVTADVSLKQIELLKIVIPGLSRVGVLVNPGNPSHAGLIRGLEAEARRGGVEVLSADARSSQDIESAIAKMVFERVQAMIVAGDAFFLGQGQRIAQLALKKGMPTISAWREHTAAGALMSYGHNILENFRRAATYVDKILKGAKAGDLPIEQPYTLYLVINRITANSLGLKLPAELLLRADEVIE